MLADELPGYDQAPIAAAIQRIDGPGEEPFAALLSDFVRSPSNRDVVYQRLTALLSRADQRDRDLEGLFGE